MVGTTSKSNSSTILLFIAAALLVIFVDIDIREFNLFSSYSRQVRQLRKTDDHSSLLASVPEDCELVFKPDRRLQGDYDKTVSDIPSYFTNTKNVWDTVEAADIPIFYYYGFAGGLQWTQVSAQCLSLTQLSPKKDPLNMYATFSPPLATVIHSDDEGKYLNIDPSTTDGLAQVVTYGAATQADVLVAPLLPETLSMIPTAEHQGRVFMLIRHPVKRIVEQFYYIQSATFDPDFSAERAALSIDQYMESNDYIDNVFVRQMLQLASTDEITDAHVTTVKEILRQKILVGIQEWLDESIIRFEYYFGWNAAPDLIPDRDFCRKLLTQQDDHFPLLQAGSPEWGNALIRNWADMEVFAYAKIIFGEQSKLIYSTTGTP